MRSSNQAKTIRLAGPLLALAVLAAFTAITWSADEPALDAAPSPDTRTVENASAPSPDAAPAAPAAPEAPAASATEASPELALDPIAALAAAEDTPPDEVIPMQEDEGTGVEPVTGQNLINVTVENETLENVVNMFARISGANIVTTSADLGGTVTVNLRGVEWKPALSSILDVHSLALIEKLPGSGVYTIVPKPSGEEVPLVVETVFLNFTTVAEMGPLARSMLGSVSNAAVTEFPTRNAMVIKTTEPNMREIRTLVEQMDVPGRQVVVETKFMELTDGASKKLGIRWDSLDEYAVRIGPEMTYSREITRHDIRNNITTRSESRSQNDSSVSGDSFVDSSERFFDADGNQIEDATYTLFDPNPNVDGDEVIQEEVVPTRTISESVQNSANASRNTSFSESSTLLTGPIDPGSEDQWSFHKNIIQSTTAILDFDQFNAVLSALEKTDGVSVISNPKLIVASGSTDAYFTVGDREPIIRTEVQRGTQESPGDTITAELDTAIETDYIKKGYLETGIHLQVVPVVKTDDLIEASIEPKLVRRVLPDKVVGENSWPRIAVKEIKTQFTLRSGQTVAIGGLTDSSDDKQTTKVPLLGDIPLIGKYLFSHKADVRRQVETIIFVTLSLADAQNLYREAGIPEDATLVHKQLIKRETEREDFEHELEGIRKAAEEEKARKADENSRAKSKSKPKRSR